MQTEGTVLMIPAVSPIFWLEGYGVHVAPPANATMNGMGGMLISLGYLPSWLLNNCPVYC